MVRTRYSYLNGVMLLLGALVGLADGWLAMMAYAFSSGPVRGLVSGLDVAVLFSSVAIIIASLITFRWPGVGATVSWCMVAICGLSAFVAPVAIPFLLLAGAEGLISTIIAARSDKTVGALSILS